MSCFLWLFHLLLVPTVVWTQEPLRLNQGCKTRFIEEKGVRVGDGLTAILTLKNVSACMSMCMKGNHPCLGFDFNHVRPRSNCIFYRSRDKMLAHAEWSHFHSLTVCPKGCRQEIRESNQKRRYVDTFSVINNHVRFPESCDALCLRIPNCLGRQRTTLEYEECALFFPGTLYTNANFSVITAYYPTWEKITVCNAIDPDCKRFGLRPELDHLSSSDALFTQRTPDCAAQCLAYDDCNIKEYRKYLPKEPCYREYVITEDYDPRYDHGQRVVECRSGSAHMRTRCFDRFGYESSRLSDYNQMLQEGVTEVNHCKQICMDASRCLAINFNLIEKKCYLTFDRRETKIGHGWEMWYISTECETEYIDFNYKSRVDKSPMFETIEMEPMGMQIVKCPFYNTDVEPAWRFGRRQPERTNQPWHNQCTIARRDSFVPFSFVHFSGPCDFDRSKIRLNKQNGDLVFDPFVPNQYSGFWECLSGHVVKTFKLIQSGD